MHAERVKHRAWPHLLMTNTPREPTQPCKKATPLISAEGRRLFTKALPPGLTFERAYDLDTTTLETKLTT